MSRRPLTALTPLALALGTVLSGCHQPDDCEDSGTCATDHGEIATAPEAGGAGGLDPEAGGAGGLDPEAGGAGGLDPEAGGASGLPGSAGVPSGSHASEGTSGTAATDGGAPGTGAGGAPSGGETTLGGGAPATGAGGTLPVAGAPGGGAQGGSPAPNAGGAGTTGGASSTGGDGSDGGQGGGQAGGPGPDPVDDRPVCHADQLPSDGGCVVDESTGVFADPGAAPNGDGSRSAPFANLAQAINASSGRRVYLCATHGFFEESLIVSPDGSSLFGGFDCDDWTYVPGSKTQLRGGPTAARIYGDDVVLADLRIEAAPAENPGGSSVALFARRVTALSLVRVELVAADGSDGIDGRTGIDFAANGGFPSDEELVGYAGTAEASGPGCSPGGSAGACPTLDVPGAGGDGGMPDEKGFGFPGEAGQPDYLPGGQGGTPEQCTENLTGGAKGATPTEDRDGAGARTVGTLTVEGWVASAGSEGWPGLPGQGGGGSASTSAYGGGSGGGCGGCGGDGARAGTGGGGSIALASLSSTISLTACSLLTANGGRGGDAAPGTAGQPGGRGGIATKYSCAGGDGGDGQRGGAAGASAGGVSVGIVFLGSPPVVDAVTESSITVGEAGEAGARVSTVPKTIATAGVALDVLEVF